MRSGRTETEKYEEFIGAAGAYALQDALTTREPEELPEVFGIRVIGSEVFAPRYATTSEPQAQFLLLKTSGSPTWGPAEEGSWPQPSIADRYVESPFETLYQGKPDSEKFSMLAQTMRGLTQFAFADELADRIVALNEILEEEEPDLIASVDSLRSMIAFFRSNPGLRKPMLFLTNIGNFRAVWQASPNRRFAIEFLPNGSVWFVVFTPDIFSPDGVNRFSGATSVANIMDYARSTGANRWMCR